MSNFWTRTISGTIYTAAIVTGTVIWPAAFPFMAIVCLYYMLHEFFTISLGENCRLERILAMAAAVLFFALNFATSQYGIGKNIVLVCALPLLAMMIACIFRHDRYGMDKIPYILSALVYIALPVGLLPILVFRGGEYDGWMLMSFFIIVWCCDVGAYCFGTAFGQKPDSRKLAPSISPKKSWWGFWGGVVTSGICALVLYFIGCFDVPLVHAIVLGALIGGAAVCGDLFESLWKRHFDVKDSGNAIPGHGGFLDRLDSSLLAFPIATIYLAIFDLL